MQGTAGLKGAAKHFEYTISFFLLVFFFFFNQGNLSTIHDGLGKKKIRDLHSSQSLPRMIEFICLYFFFRYHYISWCNSLKIDGSILSSSERMYLKII